ncbi:MAG TPA: hypothetical protein VF599_15010 [Pyrinomonadaceae bacterium]|jgi:hypothetical protein
MKEISKPVSPEKPNAFKAIVFGGLLAGVLDLAAACVNSGVSGVSPIRVFQAIASGWLGAESYRGGAATAALGVFLHFVIAFGAAIVYYLASRKIEFLTNQPIICGIVYGIAVYWFMQLIVLPLSNFPGRGRFELTSVLVGLIIHILFVGLPIALVASRYSKLER